MQLTGAVLGLSTALAGCAGTGGGANEGAALVSVAGSPPASPVASSSAAQFAADSGTARPFQVAQSGWNLGALRRQEPPLERRVHVLLVNVPAKIRRPGDAGRRSEP